MPTSGSSNPELGTRVLTQLIKKVVEEVLKTKIKEIRETLQAGCLECKKRRDYSSQKVEPRSVNRVKTRPNFSACEHYNRCHPVTVVDRHTLWGVKGAIIVGFCA
ncbi:hypothetical protein J1N35_043552 [Gossypium stocksii]|uniref:Uncharacterized protein n=1 Tax=Gossypium stocksii TaxID=47602 RepID=A0A9D3U7M0_9ROSI|nr:hypothetical protein J1N35_043552 [Gossypium stocksii]